MGKLEAGRVGKLWMVPAYLNLFSRSDDGMVAFRSGRLYLIPRKAGHVVPVNVAPNETLNLDEVLRGKPVQFSIVSLITKR